MRQEKPAWKRNVTYNKKEFTIGPLEVIVRNNDVEKAIRDLKNKMSKDGVLTELKKRRFAEKPSEAKRRKKREALKKIRKSKNRRIKIYRKKPNKE